MHYSRMPLPRRRSKPKHEIAGLEPVYSDNENNAVLGFWKLNEPEIGGAFVRGIAVYSANRRLITCVPTVGDAVMHLKAREHNRRVADEWLDFFEADDDD